MKYKTLLLMVVAFPIIFGASTIERETSEVVDVITIDEIKEDVEFSKSKKLLELDDLTKAMIFVESRGDSMAVGDTHLRQPSIGILQIRPIMVREINRISKKQGLGKEFSMSDRYSKTKSLEMFNIWREYYHPNSNYEAIARTWNGGPNGLRNARTLNYWNKVSRELNNLNLDI
jgi:hypothetical protein